MISSKYEYRQKSKLDCSYYDFCLHNYFFLTTNNILNKNISFWIELLYVRLRDKVDRNGLYEGWFQYDEWEINLGTSFNKFLPHTLFYFHTLESTIKNARGQRIKGIESKLSHAITMSYRPKEMETEDSKKKYEKAIKMWRSFKYFLKKVS